MKTSAKAKERLEKLASKLDAPTAAYVGGRTSKEKDAERAKLGPRTRKLMKETTR